MGEFIEEKTEIDLEFQYVQDLCIRAQDLFNPDDYSNLTIFGAQDKDSYSFEDRRIRYKNYFQEKASRQTYEEEGSGEKCCGEEVGKERTDYQLLILKIEQLSMIEIESPKDESLREQVLSEVERPENDDSDNYDPVAQEFEQRHQTQPRPKKKGIKKSKKRQPAYPTKNFLPTFRGLFLNYLSPHFKGNYFDNLQIVKRIRGKASINMGDYKDLFKVKEFRPLLAEYFSNKTIFRDLFKSRISYENKKEYMKRLHVFQTAFTYGTFDQINERRKKASLKG